MDGDSAPARSEEGYSKVSVLCERIFSGAAKHIEIGSIHEFEDTNPRSSSFSRAGRVSSAACIRVSVDQVIDVEHGSTLHV
jgi:hypothetical protein